MSIHATMATGAVTMATKGSGARKSSSSESVLRLGDELFFLDPHDHILVAKSPLETRACVQPSSRCVAIRTTIFKLEPQQSHISQKELEAFLGDDDLDSLLCEATAEELTQLQLLQQRAAKEISQNETEKRRLLGKPVLYGQVIQLLNTHFKKYLTVTGKTSAQHRLQVSLSSVAGYFRIMPRYRIRFVGDTIRVGETVALQCVRPEGYLNVDETTYGVYSHTRISSWTMRLHYSSASDQDTKHIKYTNSGQYVRFYHKEMESYLEAPAIHSHNELVLLKKHIINPLDPKESDSPLAFWEIENVDISRGCKVRWKKPIRIRHAASGAYLYIDPSHVQIDIATGKTTFTLKLLKNLPDDHHIDPSQDMTLFQLIPISAPSISGIPYGSFVRIQHVLTQCWMHAANGEEDVAATVLEPTSFNVPVTSMSPASSLPEKQLPLAIPSLSLRQHTRFNSTESTFSSVVNSHIDTNTTVVAKDMDPSSIYYHISTSQELYYHDCFSITLVEEPLADTFNFVNDMMPQLQSCLHHYQQAATASTDKEVPYSQLEFITQILKTLIRFCTKSKEADPLKRVGIPIVYHQTLLREIGIIETVMDMIMAPFQLTKRNQQEAKGQQHPSDEEIASNPELNIVFTLCYHLLRVFLIRKSPFEEQESVSVENQMYVYRKAIKKGMISMFIKHLSFDIGATDMMIELAQVIVDDKVLALLDPLVIDKTMAASGLINVTSSNSVHAVNWIRLLNALCQKASVSNVSDDHVSSSLLAFRDKVIDKLFTLDSSCLLQTRMAIEKKQVEIRLGVQDTWLNLNDIIYEHSHLLGFLESILELICSLSCKSNVKTIELMSICVGKEVCLKSLKNNKLPSTLRSKFCDLIRVLYVDICNFQKVALSDYTIYTKSSKNDTEYYPFGSSSFESEFYQSLKRWTFRFLDTKHHEFIANTEDIQFLAAVLRLIHTQLRLGFFQTPRDVGILFRALVQVLDGRTDARNEKHHKYIIAKSNPREWLERYVMTEKNQFVMDTKVQILQIFDLIFDLRLRVRISKLANIWKVVTENKTAEYHTSPNESGLLLMLSVFEETELRDREESLMPILKDILKYQYAPLKQIAIVVMHRLFTDSQEMFEKVSDAVILKDPEQASVYNTIKTQLSVLQSLTYIDGYNDSPRIHHLAEIKSLIEQFQSLLVVPCLEYDDTTTPKYDTSIYCRIFKSLDACELLVDVLKSLQHIPAKHYHAHIDIIHACLQLLCTVTKNDKALQSQFVLTNMDLLIDLTQLSPKLAIVFAQLCSNNLYLSMHIKEEHLMRIIETSEGYQGTYLIVLVDLLKPQGKLVKKNQDSVMRFIMDHRHEYVPFENVMGLKKMHDSDYCIHLIEVLAMCGQGENTFGQSFARTIFSMQDVFDVMQDQDVSIGLKSVMLQFLAFIYIEDVESPSDIPMYDSQSILWLMTISKDVMMRCLYTDDDDNDDTAGRSYVFGGVLAFLRAMFEHHISIETAANEMFYLYTKLVDLTVKLLPLAYDDEKKLQATLSCLDSMINVAGFRGSADPISLRDTLIEATDVLKRLYVRNHNREQYTSSTSIHHMFPIQDTVNISFQTLFNEIKSSQAIEQYQQEEFERLCSHFNLSNVHGDSCSSVESLIAYLSTMTATTVNERVERYQVLTIKLLEEVAMQYIRKRSGTDPNQDALRYEELEQLKTKAQNTLNDLGCTLVAQNLLSSPRRKIFDAALKLLISLLEGGNKNVQDRLEEYFYSIREERFFYSFNQRLQSGINYSKDAQIALTRKVYKMNRQRYIMDNILLQQQQQQQQQIKKPIAKGHNRGKSYTDNKRNSHQLMLRKRTSSIYISQQQRPITKEANDLYQEISQLFNVTNTSESMSELESTVKDYRVMQDTMRTLQLMVEGHNLSLQTYLAKQPDNIKSFNIVLDVVEYFHAIVPLCNAKNIELIIQVLDTITELAQGCLQNQVTIFNNKIINPVNTILREAYDDCECDLLNELKSKVVTCLLSLLEGGIENSETIYREMIDSLDLVTVKSNMDANYTENLDSLQSKHVYEKLECGFLYCILVMTLAPALDQEQSAMFFENNQAFNYFKSRTGKIEIVMDYGQEKQLTRVLFPIPEICQYLREETKQRFLWNAKRDSPSCKIEDFVQQTGMIIYEIENQAHVAHSKHLSFLTDYSAFWWESAYGVSILLNMLLMMYPDLLDATTTINNKPLIFLFLYLLGLVHLALWLLLTAEFYFIQLPVLINRRHGSAPSIPSLAAWWATLTDTHFLYHVLMVIFSAIGLIYPGFYSIHLLDFVFRDSILQGVISSITLNIHSISRTAILGIIVIYIHSIIAYKYFRKEFDDTKGLFCGSLMECFITVLSHGVRSGGGIGDILEPDELHKPSGWRTIFEMSFYLVVVVFLLNAIFGIIFDTFGHLRDERSSIQQDMKNSCYICSIPAAEFQRHTKKGFEDHVKNDHNIWQYLFFFVHLRNKDRTEYTGPESYVACCLKDMDYSFFPINRALGLFTEEHDDKERLDKLEEMNHSLLEKLAKLEEQIGKIGDHQARSRQNSFMLSPM